MMAKKKAYVVFRGKVPGIYENWAEVRPLVQGYPGAVYKGYESRREAEEALQAFQKEDRLPYGNGAAGMAGNHAFEPFFEIHTDGGAIRNPGPGGYAFVILDREGQILTEAFGAEPDSTNNRMETTAILKAMELIPEGAAVNFRADSNYVYQGMQSWWPNWEKKNLWSEKKNTDLIRPLWALAKKRKLSFGPKDRAHEPALSDGRYTFPFNKICDRLSNLGEELAEKGERGLYFLIREGKVLDERAILVDGLDSARHGYTVNVHGERLSIL
ncbi:MAG: ribonuclease H family protein [Lachnospiraceae bacterium]|nr:ribonuclease H family protein [Lachnospiraceae bacterium]